MKNISLKNSFLFLIVTLTAYGTEIYTTDNETPHKTFEEIADDLFQSENPIEIVQQTLNHLQVESAHQESQSILSISYDPNQKNKLNLKIEFFKNCLERFTRRVQSKEMEQGKRARVYSYLSKEDTQNEIYQISQQYDDRWNSLLKPKTYDQEWGHLRTSSKNNQVKETASSDNSSEKEFNSTASQDNTSLSLTIKFYNLVNNNGISAVIVTTVIVATSMYVYTRYFDKKDHKDNKEDKCR